MSTIGIIMATYNGEKYLTEQIESILSNTYTNWKLSIYDDGSTDSTLSIIADYEKRYPDKIKGYQNPKNLGVKLNFLHALKNSNEDYVMCCDQDDVWLPEKIQLTYQKMLELEKKYPNKPNTVYTDAKIVDENLNVMQSSFYKTSNLDVRKVDLPHLLMENKLLGCTIMVNKEVITKLEIPQNLRMHDWWIGLLSACFGNIAFLKQPTILYRQHAANVIGGQGKLAYLTNRISSLNKQKNVIKDTEEQAEQFYKLYKNSLSENQRNMIKQFARLHKENWMKRRYIAIKYGFLKTGIIRNIGVLLIL
ncbi:glycosyltransferase family 2 protein [Anaeromicropila herbilytica]|uniref:Glycosyl transferase n=1 Tax=Anaeromicropila herbilytica TaxID=2785025 RepID=A0A7R7IDT1_9FIRM|nr:glycosyltransferase family 2 protein [Anaeromicropila herbilytica]BCN32043.1 glycosyl transferase [Anaeromicropila herbilytica]